jgi:hypothetical protein
VTCCKWHFWGSLFPFLDDSRAFSLSVSFSGYSLGRFPLLDDARISPVLTFFPGSSQVFPLHLSNCKLTSTLSFPHPAAMNRMQISRYWSCTMRSALLCATSVVCAFCATASFVTWSFQTARSLFSRIPLRPKSIFMYSFQAILGILLCLGSIGLLPIHAYCPLLKQGIRHRVYQVPAQS